MISPTSEIPVPVTFNLPITLWVAWISTIAIGLGGIAMIFKFIMKASKLISDVDEYGSVLKQIAREFKSDSGSTLKDSINRIEKAASEAKATALVAQHTSEKLSNLILERQK